MSEPGRVLYASIHKRESSYPVFAVPVCSVRCVRSGPKQEPSHQAKAVGTDGWKRILAVATTSFKDKLPEAFASSFVLFSGVRQSPSRADGPPQVEEERGGPWVGLFGLSPSLLDLKALACRAGALFSSGVRRAVWCHLWCYGFEGGLRMKWWSLRPHG